MTKSVATAGQLSDEHDMDCTRARTESRAPHWPPKRRGSARTRHSRRRPGAPFRVAASRTGVWAARAAIAALLSRRPASAQSA